MSRRHWVWELSPAEFGELGDALVLGTFDWRDWYERKPTPVELRALNTAWSQRESCQG